MLFCNFSVLCLGVCPGMSAGQETSFNVSGSLLTGTQCMEHSSLALWCTQSAAGNCHRTRYKIRPSALLSEPISNKPSHLGEGGKMPISRRKKQTQNTYAALACLVVRIVSHVMCTHEEIQCIPLKKQIFQ